MDSVPEKKYLEKNIHIPRRNLLLIYLLPFKVLPTLILLFKNVLFELIIFFYRLSSSLGYDILSVMILSLCDSLLHYWTYSTNKDIGCNKCCYRDSS
jgi:hypothetical protein